MIRWISIFTKSAVLAVGVGPISPPTRWARVLRITQLLRPRVVRELLAAIERQLRPRVPPRARAKLARVITSVCLPHSVASWTSIFSGCHGLFEEVGLHIARLLLVFDPLGWIFCYAIRFTMRYFSCNLIGVTGSIFSSTRWCFVSFFAKRSRSHPGFEKHSSWLLLDFPVVLDREGASTRIAALGLSITLQPNWSTIKSKRY